jgi:hypothetical protein
MDFFGIMRWVIILLTVGAPEILRYNEVVVSISQMKEMGTGNTMAQEEVQGHIL